MLAPALARGEIALRLEEGRGPGASAALKDVRKRYRALAAIHHPDGSHGEHKRMSQLNEAVRILRGKG